MSFFNDNLNTDVSCWVLKITKYDEESIKYIPNTSGQRGGLP